MRSAVGARRAGAITGVAGGVKQRSAVAHPILVHGKFERRHLRVNVDVPSRDRVEVVVSQRLVKRVAHIDASNVAVTGPSQIVGANVVRMDSSVDHRSSRLWAHQKTIVVVVDTGVVAVVVEAELGCIALGEKSLYVRVRDVHLLPALVESVQAAVRVFFQKIKPREIVGQSIGTQVAKDSHARLRFGKKESAEVAG